MSSCSSQGKTIPTQSIQDFQECRLLPRLPFCPLRLLKEIGRLQPLFRGDRLPLFVSQSGSTKTAFDFAVLVVCLLKTLLPAFSRTPFVAAVGFSYAISLFSFISLVQVVYTGALWIVRTFYSLFSLVVRCPNLYWTHFLSRPCSPSAVAVRPSSASLPSPTSPMPALECSGPCPSISPTCMP